MDGSDAQPRFFTYDDANRTLPLVRRIVEDILEQYRELEPLVAAGDRNAAEVRQRAQAIDDLVAELHALGCRFKGFSDGLVDWYSRYAGRTVLLCWKHGEPEIAWWHQLDAGFAGRQPILPGQREAFRGE
jgi:hypothetical protein